MQCSGVQWNGSMECNAVEWNAMDAIWVILTLLVVLGRNLIVFVQKRKKVNFSTRRRQIHPTSLKIHFFQICLFVFAAPPHFCRAKNAPPHFCTPKTAPRTRTFDFLFVWPPDNFHFSRVAHFFSFCEARSKMPLEKRRATKLPFFKNEFLLCFFNVLLCVF